MKYSIEVEADLATFSFKNQKGLETKAPNQININKQLRASDIIITSLYFVKITVF